MSPKIVALRVVLIGIFPILITFNLSLLGLVGIILIPFWMNSSANNLRKAGWKYPSGTTFVSFCGLVTIFFIVYRVFYDTKSPALLLLSSLLGLGAVYVFILLTRGKR